MEDTAVEGMSGCDDKTHRGRGDSSLSQTQGRARVQMDTVDGAVDRGGNEKRLRCAEDGRQLNQLARTEEPSPGSGGAGKNREETSQSRGHDPQDKAIVRWVVKQQNKTLTGAQCMQSKEEEAPVSQGERRSNLEDEVYLGRSVSSVDKDSLNENGNIGGETRNVGGDAYEEDKGSFELPSPKSRGKEMTGLVELGHAIDTPLKTCSNQNIGPVLKTAPFLTPMLVYSRKGNIKKAKAHIVDVASNQDDSSPERIQNGPFQQNNNGHGSANYQMQTAIPSSDKKHENQLQEEKSDPHVESVWRMINELGLTTGSSQRDYIQQLSDMEVRDGVEVARLGDRGMIS